MWRSVVAKKYAREEQATHERRQRAVGSRWRWECMKDHPMSSFLFVLMLMDRLTSEVLGLPMEMMFAEYMVVRAGCRRYVEKANFTLVKNPLISIVTL